VLFVVNDKPSMVRAFLIEILMIPPFEAVYIYLCVCVTSVFYLHEYVSTHATLIMHVRFCCALQELSTSEEPLVSSSLMVLAPDLLPRGIHLHPQPLRQQ
jgi:hypothetical protein